MHEEYNISLIHTYFMLCEPVEFVSNESQFSMLTTHSTHLFKAERFVLRYLRKFCDHEISDRHRKTSETPTSTFKNRM